jgi:hypothetical protein
MRSADPPVQYLVGTPRGRLTKLEKAFIAKPREEARASVRVKLVEHESETYVLARSLGRRAKESAMCKRRLRKLIRRLCELRQ